MDINLHLARGKMSENSFQNYSDAFTKASERTSLRPIVHLVKITKTKTFCYEQTYLVAWPDGREVQTHQKQGLLLGTTLLSRVTRYK